MAIRNIDLLKSWFVTGAYPTQQQFWDWLDSYRHKSDKLNISDVNNLDHYLNDFIATANKIVKDALSGNEDRFDNVEFKVDDLKNNKQNKLVAEDGSIELKDNPNGTTSIKATGAINHGIDNMVWFDSRYSGDIEDGSEQRPFKTAAAAYALAKTKVYGTIIVPPASNIDLTGVILDKSIRFTSFPTMKNRYASWNLKNATILDGVSFYANGANLYDTNKLDAAATNGNFLFSNCTLGEHLHLSKGLYVFENCDFSYKTAIYKADSVATTNRLMIYGSINVNIETNNVIFNIQNSDFRGTSPYCVPLRIGKTMGIGNCFVLKSFINSGGLDLPFNYSGGWTDRPVVIWNCKFDMKSIFTADSWTAIKPYFELDPTTNYFQSLILGGDYLKMQSSSTQEIDSNISFKKSILLESEDGTDVDGIKMENDGTSEQVTIGSTTKQISVKSLDRPIIKTPEGKENAAYLSDIENKQDKLIAGTTIKNIAISNQTTSLLGSGTLYIDAGTNYNYHHIFGQDTDMDNKIVDQNTIQGDLGDMNIGYTQFGQARLLQLTIRFKSLRDIQNLIFSWQPFGIQISNDFGNLHGNGAIIARVSNGKETSLVELESAFTPDGRGFRVTSSASIDMGDNCSLMVFVYGM